MIQTKLTIGQPGDKYEQEADAMAEKVVQRLSDPAPAPVLQAKFDACEKEGENKISMMQDLTMAPAQEKEEDVIQTKAEKVPNTATPSLESRLSTTKGGGSPLPGDTMTNMNAAFGSDFSGVRIHKDSSAVQMNRELGAKAFTNGSDVYFNSGNYNTQSKDGQFLLAHELVHTMQQKSDSKNNTIDGSNRNTLIQRDMATPLPTPKPAVQPDLTQGNIRRAIRYNSRRFRKKQTEIIQDLAGANITGKWDEKTVILIARMQENFGLKKDGMVGPKTAIFLDKEQKLENISDDNNNVIYSFRTPIGNVKPVHAVRGGQDWIEAHFKIEVVFPERTGCNDWEYRQEIRGDAWAQRLEFAKVNLNHFFSLLPSPLHSTNWNEDGNTSWGGINYGHRHQTGKSK